jgi:hypothetical protein
MACFLPFRSWYCPSPRVFDFRTTGDSSTDPTARPLLHLHATSVVFPNARSLKPKAKPTLPFGRSSSHRSVTLQHVQTKKPFFALGLHQAFKRHCHAA